MANRKFLIESILGLAQKIGANPNKFMGTKTNINFLGTGDKGMKGTTFSGQLNENFLDLGFRKNDMIKVIEQDAGYVTAGKLDDVQLNTMFNNLKMIDETFNPPPGPKNVIDLETGTGNINKEGLESLRESDKIRRFYKGMKTSNTAMSNKIKEGIRGLKNKLTGGADDVATKSSAEADFTRMGAADFGDSIQAEGARRAVVRQLMKNNPDEFMLPPETLESISLSKDLQRGGANAPDPLTVFRNIGNFTKQELDQIDEVIQQSPFDDINIISERVFEFIKKIRPEGFRPGFRSGKSVKGIAELLKLTNKKFGKDALTTADKIKRPELTEDFERLTKKLTDSPFDDLKSIADDFGPMGDDLPPPGSRGGPDDIAAPFQSADDYRQSLRIEIDKFSVAELTPEALRIKYPGITDELAELIGNDTNLQRKAEAIATIDQAMALKGAGKSADETIAILKGEPETKMSKGGLARILEM
jgi:hypothetical protein